MKISKARLLSIVKESIDKKRSIFRESLPDKITAPESNMSYPDRMQQSFYKRPVRESSKSINELSNILSSNYSCPTKNYSVELSAIFRFNDDWFNNVYRYRSAKKEDFSKKFMSSVDVIGNRLLDIINTGRTDDIDSYSSLPCAFLSCINTIFELVKRHGSKIKNEHVDYFNSENGFDPRDSQEVFDFISRTYIAPSAGDSLDSVILKKINF